jgi:hypothetical protein
MNTLNLSFRDYVNTDPHNLDEGLKDFIQNVKSGFSQGYQKWDAKKVDPTGGDATKINPEYEKFKGTVLPALQKAKSFMGKASQMTGISPPLAMAVLASGIVGGPAAIPMGVLMYFTRKMFVNPVVQAAGKGWDAAFGPKKVREPEELPGFAKEWRFSLDFDNYSIYKEGCELGLIENKSFRVWVQEADYEKLEEISRALNWLGSMAGKGAGYLAGAVKTIGGKALNVIKGGIKDIATWARANKASIAKTAFLMALGYMIGSGVTKLTNSVIDSAMQTVQGAAEQTGAIPEEEVNNLSVKLSHDVDKDIATGVAKDLKYISIGGEEQAKLGIPTGTVAVPVDVYAQGKEAILQNLKAQGASDAVIGAADRSLPPDFTGNFYKTMAGQSTPTDPFPKELAAANQMDISGNEPATTAATASAPAAPAAPAATVANKPDISPAAPQAPATTAASAPAGTAADALKAKVDALRIANIKAGVKGMIPDPLNTSTKILPGGGVDYRYAGFVPPTK